MNRGDSSISGISYLGKSKDYKEKNSLALIEKGIDDALRNKSLLAVHDESMASRYKVSSSLSLQPGHLSPTLHSKRKAPGAVSVDTSASALLPKLQGSLHLHSFRGIMTAEQKIESMIKEHNDTVYKK